LQQLPSPLQPLPPLPSPLQQLQPLQPLPSPTAIRRFPSATAVELPRPRQDLPVATSVGVSHAGISEAFSAQMAAVQQACLPVALAVPPPLDRSTGLSANFGQVALGALPPPFGSAAAAAAATLDAAPHGAGRPPAVEAEHMCFVSATSRSRGDVFLQL